MSSNSSGTVVWVPMQGGRTIRMPWMRNASLIEARDGNDKKMVAALLSFKSENCPNRSAMVMYDEVGTAVETVGECDAHIRLSETDGATVVVDDVTLAVLRVSGTELVTIRAPIKKTPPVQKPEATTPAPPASPTVPTTPAPPTLPTVPGQPARATTDGGVNAAKSTSSASSPAATIPKPQPPHSIISNPGLPKTIQNRY